MRAILLIVLILASPVLAQTTQPATRPAGLSAEEMLNQLLRPTTQSARPLQPIPDGGGGAINRNTGGGAVAPGAPQLHLLPEGTLLVDRVARIAKTADTQQWELTLETDGRLMLDPPLLILPNRTFAAMQNLVTGSSADLKFRITGEVTEYNGRNYILIQRASQIPDIVQPK